VEHLVAAANGGGNGDDNTVACCKALNSLLGRMSLKEKLRVVSIRRANSGVPTASPSRNLPSRFRKEHSSASRQIFVSAVQPT